jgi:hypothetical protein
VQDEEEEEEEEEEDLKGIPFLSAIVLADALSRAPRLFASVLCG